ncbi:MAG: TorF family putative porin [bacterium]
MKNLLTKKGSIIITVILLLTIGNLNAQSLSVGTDVVSRYVWRGLELGSNTPNVQPSVEFVFGSLAVGFWGAYSLSETTGLNEIDIYASYSVDLSNAGSMSLGVTDYTNPNSGVKIGNFNNYDNEADPGAHYIELNAGYTGGESFPISLSFNMFLYNLKNNPIYFQLGYSTSVEDVALDIFAGGTPGEDNGYYGVTDFSIINVGFTASKSIKFTEDFSLPLFGSVILNPASENLFFVVGFSL